MRDRVGVLAGQFAGFGFRLAGLGVDVVGSEQEALEALRSSIGAERDAVVLLEDDLISPSVRPWVDSGPPLPIVIPFPGPARVRLPGSAEAYVSELLRRAIGYRVRLR